MFIGLFIVGSGLVVASNLIGTIFGKKDLKIGDISLGDMPSTGTLYTDISKLVGGTLMGFAGALACVALAQKIDKKIWDQIDF